MTARPSIARITWSIVPILRGIFQISRLVETAVSTTPARLLLIFIKRRSIEPTSVIARLDLGQIVETDPAVAFKIDPTRYLHEGRDVRISRRNRRGQYDEPCEGRRAGDDGW